MAKMVVLCGNVFSRGAKNIGYRQTNDVTLHRIPISIDVRAMKHQYTNFSSDMGYQTKCTSAFRVDFPSNALVSHVLGSHKRVVGYQTRPYIVAAKDNIQLIHNKYQMI
jgi:hypothetical protein